MSCCGCFIIGYKKILQFEPWSLKKELVADQIRSSFIVTKCFSIYRFVLPSAACTVLICISLCAHVTTHRFTAVLLSLQATLTVLYFSSLRNNRFLSTFPYPCNHSMFSYFHSHLPLCSLANVCIFISSVP